MCILNKTAALWKHEIPVMREMLIFPQKDLALGRNFQFSILNSQLSILDARKDGDDEYWKKLKTAANNEES